MAITNKYLFRFSRIGYVLLLPLFFLMHSYNELFGFIRGSDIFIFCLIIYLFTGVVFAIAWLLTRSISISTFITFCCLVFMLFWGAWHDFVKSATNHTVLGRYVVVIPGTILFFTALIWYFIKRPSQLQKVSKYISLVVLILCCLEILNFFIHYTQFRKDNNLIYPNRPICNSYVSCKQADSLKPDIFFIIFDEYTNNRTLQYLWHFDNSGITNRLLQKGFYIPDSSKANFNFTPYSISSILNMNYPAIKGDNIDALPVYFLKAVKSMSDNEAFCLLQKEHYNFHFIGPFNNSFENLDIDREFNDFVEKKLYYQTFPLRFNQDLGYHFKTPGNVTAPGKAPERSYVKRAHDNDIIISKIKSTVDSTTTRPPQFVYGHLMITHKPHLYDSLGNVRLAADVWRNVPFFNTYISQVKQANKRIQELQTTSWLIIKRTP